MRHTILAAAVAAVLAAPAVSGAATDADFEELRRTLEQVSQRLDRLEAQNRDLEAKNQQLQDKNRQLEESNERQTDQIAQSRAKSSAMDWASKLSWKGDLRYRHEYVDAEEAANDQTRHRIRARFGATAKISDALGATVQLATGGGSNDPRSTNQTLGSGWDRKGVAIDLAYADWKPFAGANLLMGKIAHPIQKVPSAFFDNDINPEGIAFRYSRGPFFGNLYGYALQESGTMSDSNVVGGQLGLKQKIGELTLTGAVGYYDLGAVEGEIVSISAAGDATLCPGVAPAPVSGVNNGFFAGSTNGNTTRTVGRCTVLANDFNVVDVLGQADFRLGSLPVALFGQLAQNQEVDDLDTAWAGGFSLGRASDPGTWEFSYSYQKIEKDALFGQFVDSDFGGGITDVKGSTLRLGYAPWKGMVVNGTYFLNDRFVDVGTERGYDRWQLDFSYRY